MHAYPGPANAPFSSVPGISSAYPGWDGPLPRPNTVEGLQQAMSDMLVQSLAPYLIVAAPTTFFGYAWFYGERRSHCARGETLPTPAPSLPRLSCPDWETGYGPCPNSTALCAAPPSWFADFSRPLGPPLGPPVVSGTVWTRSFTSAFVFVDLANRSKSAITWLSASSTQSPTPSLSGSPTMTRTQTGSQTSTQSVSRTQTTTQTGTLSLTQTSSASSSESGTRSSSVSDPSASDSMSPTGTPSPAQPASPAASDSSVVRSSRLGPGSLAAAVIIPIVVCVGFAVALAVIARRRLRRRLPVAVKAPDDVASGGASPTFDELAIRGTNPFRICNPMAEGAIAMPGLNAITH